VRRRKEAEKGRREENEPGGSENDGEETVRVLSESLHDGKSESDGLSATGLSGSDAIGAWMRGGKVSSRRKRGVTSLVSPGGRREGRTGENRRDTGSLYARRSATSHCFQGIDEEGFDLEGFPGGGLRRRDES